MAEEHNNREYARILGQNLRTARAASGLTQEQVAEKIGITSEFYARMERGRSVPSMRTLIRSAQALDSSVQHLLEGAQHIVQDERADPPELDGDIRYVLEHVRRRPRSLRVIMTVLKELQGD